MNEEVPQLAQLLAVKLLNLLHQRHLSLLGQVLEEGPENSSSVIVGILWSIIAEDLRTLLLQLSVSMGTRGR